MKNKEAGEKLGIYLPSEHIKSIKAESVRLDRSVSWLLRQAWSLAEKKIKEFPDVTNK